MHTKRLNDVQRPMKQWLETKQIEKMKKDKQEYSYIHTGNTCGHSVNGVFRLKAAHISTKKDNLRTDASTTTRAMQ